MRAVERALGQWERKALKRVAEGKSPAVAFGSEVLAPEYVVEVREALARLEAPVKADVRNVFRSVANSIWEESRHPRDENGRFTVDGASIGNVPPVASVPVFNDSDQAELWADAHLCDDAYYAGLHAELADRLNRKLFELDKDESLLKPLSIMNVGSARTVLGYAPNVASYGDLMATLSWEGSPPHLLLFNERATVTPARLSQILAEQRAEGNLTIPDFEGLITHEYGHIRHRSQSEQGRELSFAVERETNRLIRAGALTRHDWLQACGYVLTAGDQSPHAPLRPAEMIAEAFRLHRAGLLPAQLKYMVPLMDKTNLARAESYHGTIPQIGFIGTGSTAHFAGKQGVHVAESETASKNREAFRGHGAIRASTSRERPKDRAVARVIDALGHSHGPDGKFDGGLGFSLGIPGLANPPQTHVIPTTGGDVTLTTHGHAVTPQQAHHQPQYIMSRCRGTNWKLIIPNR